MHDTGIDLDSISMILDYICEVDLDFISQNSMQNDINLQNI